MLLTIRHFSVNSLDTGLEVFESCDLGLIGRFRESGVSDGAAVAKVQAG